MFSKTFDLILSWIYVNIFFSHAMQYEYINIILAQNSSYMYIPNDFIFDPNPKTALFRIATEILNEIVKI